MLGTLTMIVLVQFSALWYRMGKIEGHLKKLNGCTITNKEKEDEP